MKILFSSSKQMNLNNLINRKNDINFKYSFDIINYIKNISKEDCTNFFKTNDDIYTINQNINVNSKKAIDLYDGISFKQLSNTENPNYQNLMILSALYAFSYAFDYISPYRFDYTMNNSKKYYNQYCNLVNKVIAKEDVVYNLASNEFTKKIVHHNMINFYFYIKKDNKLIQQSVSSKKMRGQLVNYIINNEELNFSDFTYDNFYYNELLSSNNKIVYVKELI